MKVDTRICIETRIARQAVRDLLDAGYTITLYNGGDKPELSNSIDGKAISAAMFATDEDILHVFKSGPKAVPDSFVHFVYGNDGWDVINDYGTRLETVLTRTLALCDKYEQQYG